MSEFGKRLRKLRQEADLTQGQLVKILVLVPATVGKYECHPETYPRVKALIKIANYFHVSIDYLLLGTKPTPLIENNENGDLTNSTVQTYPAIQANRGGSVFNGEQTISLEAEELLHIYNKLGVRERLKLLNFAVDLEERSKDRND